MKNKLKATNFALNSVGYAGYNSAQYCWTVAPKGAKNPPSSHSTTGAEKNIRTWISLPQDAVIQFKVGFLTWDKYAEIFHKFLLFVEEHHNTKAYLETYNEKKGFGEGIAWAGYVQKVVIDYNRYVDLYNKFAETEGSMPELCEAELDEDNLKAAQVSANVYALDKISVNNWKWLVSTNQRFEIKA